MSEFHKITVLKGGFSAEREVSLESGSAIASGLRSAGYDVVEMDVQSSDFEIPGGIDAVFIALHGTFGEDGGAQARLEELQIPYTGSREASSRVSFDKILTENCLREADVPVPASEVLSAGQKRTFPLPVAVKPPREGSSVGCHLVLNEAQWTAAFEETLTHDVEALVQQFIPGREFTVGVVDGDVLPVVEIVPEKDWYDFEAKYEVDTTQYVVPAELSVEKTEEMQALALKTFTALDARGFGRVDFRMTPEGELYVLELNSIPGFTAHSLLPKAAAAAGIDFPSLCDRIIRTAAI